MLPYSSPPAPKGGLWELAANPVCPGQGPAAAARCLSAARAAGIADSRQEMPRASLYGSVLPVKFLWDFLSIQIYECARLAWEAQEPGAGSGWVVAEPSGETRCQEGMGLGARLAPRCPRQRLPMLGGQPQARAPAARLCSQPSARRRDKPQVPPQAFGPRLPCAWPGGEFGVPATGTYRLMSQDFLTPPGAHNSEDRLLRRHPNPLAIVLRFRG